MVVVLSRLWPRIATLSTLAGLALVAYPVQTQAAEPLLAQAEEASRPLEAANTGLSIAAAETLMQEAEAAIAQGDYTQAANKYQAARETLESVSGYYRSLAGVFTGIDGRVADSLRDQALAAAQMRDRATYQQALVYRAQDQPELAVPLLIEVIESQQPTRELGQQAYQQLFELGFVELPYPRTAE